MYRTQIVQGYKLCFDDSISVGEDHLFVLDYLAFVTCARVSTQNGYHYVKSEGAHLTSHIYSLESIKYYYAQVIKKRDVFMKNNGIIRLNTPQYNSMFFELFFLTVNGHILQSSISTSLKIFSEQQLFFDTHDEIFSYFHEHRFLTRFFVKAMASRIFRLAYVYFMKYPFPLLMRLRNKN